MRYDLRRRQLKVGVVRGVQVFVHSRLIRWYISIDDHILIPLLTVNFKLILSTILAKEIQWLILTTS